MSLSASWRYYVH